MNALIIGKGKVATALSGLLRKFGWRYSLYTARGVGSRFLRQARAADVVFLAISTKDTGEAAIRYLLCCVELGIPVVTCEKGALSYHFDLLEPHLDRIGFTATVGGGSGLLWFLRRVSNYSLGDISEIILILNATINYEAWAMQNGRTWNAADAEARRLQLVEPGAADKAAVINNEVRDALCKSAIVFNLAGLGKPVSPKDFSYSLLAEDEIERLLSKAGNRFVVTIRKDEPRRFQLEGFACNPAPWFISGSFVENASKEFRGISIDHQDNAILVRNSLGGEEPVSWGTGAGTVPTAAVMFQDAQHLLARS